MRIVVGKVVFNQMPSGSLTVMVEELTAKTAVNGLIMLLPMKSPTFMVDVGFVDTEITPVEVFIEVAVIVVVCGSAPTH